jgi:biopolymer transport protein ExbB/TolQ
VIKVQKGILAGAALFMLSPVVGVFGAMWGIHSSFSALNDNETSGIGAVGGGIWEALVFTIAGLVGALVGLVLIVATVAKSRKVG